MRILTSSQMRQAEQECARIGISTATLMENAGRKVAEKTSSLLGGAEKRRIVVLVGPGNNGGDGLVAGRYLHDWGAEISICLCGKRPADDSNLNLVKQRGISVVDLTDADGRDGLEALLASADAVVDAIFGTGKLRPFEGLLAGVLDGVKFVKRQTGLRIVAVDVPSGLDADTGTVDPACLHADETITLGFPKPGLFNFPGVPRVGRLTVADIGIPAGLAPETDLEFVTREWARSVLPARPLWANKGSFGKLLVVAGSINYVGAAYLACAGATRVGTGLVMLATASSLHPVLAAKLTEVTHLPLPESSPGVISAEAADTVLKQFGDCDVALIGCGLGQSQSVAGFIKSVLTDTNASLPPLVLDADALNILAGIPEWWQRQANDAILTPHPGEMARLAQKTIEQVQSERIGIVKVLSREWRKTIVLKGSYTTIASHGQVRVSPFANAGLATAGTGDVLGGVIAGLMAQGLSCFDAAALGVFLHGEAGERVKSTLGDAGMVASDLLSELPLAIKGLKEGSGDVAGR